MHIKLSDQFKAPARHKPMRLTVLALSLACAGLQVHADPASDRINQLERKLEQSLQKVNELSARLQQLEAKQAANQPPPAPVAQAAAPAATAEHETSAKRIDALEQQVTAMSNRSTLDDGLPLHGFASVGSVFTNKKGGKSGATIESVDFYLAPQFGNRIRSLFELNTEVSEDGTVGVDMERLQLGYAFADELTLWAGRFHTPYGYWNTAFHHGAQIQTSVLRPRFLDFEDAGGILPAHSVGLWAHGGVKQGETRIDYDAWLANAPSVTVDTDTGHVGTLNPNLHGTTNSNPTIGLKLGFTPEALGGLTLGVHGYHARVGGPGSGDISVQARTVSDSTMLGGYLTYLENDWEVLSEYYHFKDKNLGVNSANYGASYNSWAAYVQAGRNFGLWTPYLRLEETSLNQLDDYFAVQESGRSYRRAVAGVRYDLGSRAALKVEFNRTHQADAADPFDTSTAAPGSFNETRLQFSVRF